MYAKVIVDVPAKETSRPFDYIVPDSLLPWTEVGSRVGVPFGHRVVQGFVVELFEHTELSRNKLKAIDHVMDLYPPLTPELVELARWMSRTYLCRELSALQAMIPGALKAKYEKYVTVNEEEDDHPWHITVSGQEEIIRYLKEKGSVKLDTLLERFPEESLWIKEQIRSGVFRETQSVKDKVSKKKVLMVYPPETAELLEERITDLPANAKRQREVLEYLFAHQESIRLTELMLKLDVGAGTVKGLADKGWIELREEEVLRDPYARHHFPKTTPLPLTDEQRQVFEPIRHAVVHSLHEVYLLHGVTGSGKTEVYLQAIRQCLDLGKEAIVLVPEIALTPQMVERFKGRFGDEVAVLHSRLSQGERYDEWRKISMKQVRVVIGARSAIFAPFTKLGLIIIDEEHESSYKQEESPKYHARDVAVERARRHGAAVLLGSATPSLESFARTLVPQVAGMLHRGSSRGPEAGGRFGIDSGIRYRLLTMKQRVENRPLPPVRIVDMRDELREGNRSMFSRALHQALGERLERKEQSVLLLNRRGYSTFVMCRTCGYTLQCPHCDIALTYHQSSHRVRCHYCGYAEQQVSVCPDCGSGAIRYFGTGTQRVEEELAKLFPGIRVIRMDVDTTSEKGSHEKWLTMFRKRQADVLLGTQMVAKGLDFPDVTLVGVIAADTVLNLPDFRAGERTFQLLTQVAGRAGRHQLPGEVFVQTYTPEHYSIIASAKHDYESFVAQELETRQALGYPPFCRLILITLSHEQIPFLVRTAEDLTSRIKQLAQGEGLLAKTTALTDGEMEILGPVASPISRIKDRYRFRCMVKYRGDAAVTDLIDRVVSMFDEVCRQQNLQISVDVDPQLLM